MKKKSLIQVFSATATLDQNAMDLITALDYVEEKTIYHQYQKGNG